MTRRKIKQFRFLYRHRLLNECPQIFPCQRQPFADKPPIRRRDIFAMHPADHRRRYDVFPAFIAAFRHNVYRCTGADRRVLQIIKGITLPCQTRIVISRIVCRQHPDQRFPSRNTSGRRMISLVNADRRIIPDLLFPALSVGPEVFPRNAVISKILIHCGITVAFRFTAQDGSDVMRIPGDSSFGPMPK